jgi:hypothetical protein
MLVCWDTQACVSIRNPTGWYLLGLWPHTGKAGQRLRMPAPLEALARLLGDPPQPSLETLLLPVRGTWGEAGGGGAPQVPEAPLLQVGSTGPGARRRSQKRLCCQCAARRRRGRGGGAPQVPEAQAAVVAGAEQQVLAPGRKVHVAHGHLVRAGHLCRAPHRAQVPHLPRVTAVCALG